MCYHYDAAGNNKAMKRFSFITKSDEYTPIENANAFAHPKMPIVTNKNTNQIQLFEWGLIPHWAESIKANELKKSTLNAKSETIFELSSFKDAVQQRCLILATKFYEWRTEGSKKIPYEITIKDEEVFAMGGLFNIWTDIKTGLQKSTFTIITVPANDMMSYIHNTRLRMPLIVAPGKELEWLNTHLNQDSMRLLMKPYRSSEMKAEIIKHDGYQYSLF